MAPQYTCPHIGHVKEASATVALMRAQPDVRAAKAVDFVEKAVKRQSQ
jgi:hypothetical protein